VKSGPRPVRPVPPADAFELETVCRLQTVHVKRTVENLESRHVAARRTAKALPTLAVEAGQSGIWIAVDRPEVAAYNEFLAEQRDLKDIAVEFTGKVRPGFTLAVPHGDAARDQ